MQAPYSLTHACSKSGSEGNILRIICSNNFEHIKAIGITTKRACYCASRSSDMIEWTVLNDYSIDIINYTRWKSGNAKCLMIVLCMCMASSTYTFFPLQTIQRALVYMHHAECHFRFAFCGAGHQKKQEKLSLISATCRKSKTVKFWNNDFITTSTGKALTTAGYC